MTIQGAIADLQYLLEADDVPFYYKGGIEKIIETIQMEMADRKTEPQRGCDADCNEDCTECAKEWQDWKDQMWAEAVIEPRTEREGE